MAENTSVSQEGANDSRKLLNGEDFQASAAPTHLAEIEVFTDADFRGTPFRTNSGWSFPQDSFWNDSISSVVIISGRWRLCVNNDGRTDGGYVDKGPGRYANEGQIGLPNDSISSFYPLSDA